MFLILFGAGGDYMEDTGAKSARNMEKTKSLTVLNGSSYYLSVRKVKKS